MTVAISSRYIGPCERRENDGRYEAVLPEPTQFEEQMQRQILDRHFAQAYARIQPRRSLLGWWKR